MRERHPKMLANPAAAPSVGDDIVDADAGARRDPFEDRVPVQPADRTDIPASALAITRAGVREIRLRRARARRALAEAFQGGSEE